MIARQRSASTGEGVTIADAVDKDLWNGFVSRHPKGSIFHTSQMADVFRGVKNHQPITLAALSTDGDILALLVAVRVQTLPDPLGPISSRSILYAEPLCRNDQEGIDALQAVVAAHDARVRNSVLFTEIRPLYAAGPEKRVLLEAGYSHYNYLNYIVDTGRPRDEIWSSVGKSTKQNIRSSLNKGVRVEEANSFEGVDILYDFLRDTYKRAQVPLADKSLFVQALKILGPRGMARVSVAYHDDIPIGASIRLVHKKTSFDWYRGAERHTRLRPAECLTWHDIESSHHEGCDCYDMGGAGRPEVAYGVRDYKAKFGGELVNYGRYQRIYHPWKFALAETIYRHTRPLIGLVARRNGGSHE